MTLSLHKKGTSPAALLAAASIAGLGLSQQAEAALSIHFSQIGADVVVTASGFVDVAGGSLVHSFHLEPAGLIHAPVDFSGVYSIPVSFDEYDVGPAVPYWFVPASSFLYTSAVTSGSPFGFIRRSTYTSLVVESGFTSGFVSGHIVFSDVSLSSLGVVPTSFSWGPSDDQTVHITAVPEPSSSALLALGSIGFVLRRKR